MRDHAIGDEHLAVVVEIEPPGIGRAVGHRLDHLVVGMIPPHAAVDFHPLVGSAVPGMPISEFDRMPLQAVQPAVRTPGQAVEDVVRRLGC